LRCLRPEKVLFGVQDFVGTELGYEYVEKRPVTMEEV